MTLAPHMQRLRSVSTNVLNKGLIKTLKTLPNVKELDVVNRVPKTGLESLADLRHVEKLGLSSLPEDLAPFGAIPNLKELDLLLRGGRSNLHALDSYTERESVRLRLSLGCTLSQEELEYRASTRPLKAYTSTWGQWPVRTSRITRSFFGRYPNCPVFDTWCAGAADI